jgi:uncharacterized protein (DUF1800 family)
MPLSPLSGTLGIQRAAHLLRRANFGGSKQDIDEFANLTAPQAIAILFNASIPEASLPIDVATNEEWVISGTVEDVNSGDDELQGFFKGWFVGQMLGDGVSDPTLKKAYITREKMVLFMHTHFTTMQEKVQDSRALYFQNALFRMFAFDRDDRMVDIEDEVTGLIEAVVAPTNFKELTKKICVDNAMLIFLDGRLNVKGSPNENYGREMFELYVIGRGLESRIDGVSPPAEGDYFTYTESDVQAAARVLTGFDNDDNYQNIDPYTGLPRGIIKGGNIATQHHTEDKVFSSYYDDTIVAADPLLYENGQPNEESTLDEISQLVDMIYLNEETARQICRKLYRFYVHYEINEVLDDTIIADLAEIFTANDYKIQPVLEALFLSEHFYEAVAGVTDDKFGGIIKSPIDLLLGTLTFFDVQLPDYTSNLAEYYQVTGSLIDFMEDQGMNLYQPLEVAGYTAYHQYPVYNRNWISPNYLSQRYNFIRSLLNQTEGLPNLDLLLYVKNNFDASASDGRQLIIALCTYLFPMSANLSFEVDGGDLTKERIRYFLQAFLQFTDYDNAADVDQANTTWSNLYADPNQYLEAGEYVKRLFNVMLQSPENQLF